MGEGFEQDENSMESHSEACWRDVVPFILLCTVSESFESSLITKVSAIPFILIPLLSATEPWTAWWTGGYPLFGVIYFSPLITCGVFHLIVFMTNSILSIYYSYSHNGSIAVFFWMIVDWIAFEVVSCPLICYRIDDASPLPMILMMIRIERTTAIICTQITKTLRAQARGRFIYCLPLPVIRWHYSPVKWDLKSFFIPLPCHPETRQIVARGLVLNKTGHFNYL